jgi:hypothetical protein
MSLNQQNRLIQFAFSTAFFFATTATANATVRVGGWSFFANGQLARDYQYTGSCPVALKFNWGVVSSEPTTIKYSFLRNDGGHSAAPSYVALQNPNSSVPISEEWRLGINNQQFQDFSGWVQLNIEEPNPVSQRIGFTIHCIGNGDAGASTWVGPGKCGTTTGERLIPAGLLERTIGGAGHMGIRPGLRCSDTGWYRRLPMGTGHER